MLRLEKKGGFVRPVITDLSLQEGRDFIHDTEGKVFILVGRTERVL